MQSFSIDVQRSCCPVASFCDLFGDKWSLVVIRDLFAGKASYNEFLDSPEGIATNILRDRLGKLIDLGIVEKYYPTKRGRRASYRLTPKGDSVYPILLSIKDWALENIQNTEARIQA